MPSRFFELTPYRLSAALGDELYAAVRTWPTFDRMTCGTQLVRAVDSIGANIAESAGRWHENDKRRFFVIARASLFEAEHWLTRAERRGLVEPGTATRLEPIARGLSGLIKRPTPANRQPPTAN